MKRLMILLIVSVVFLFTFNEVYGQTSNQVASTKSRVSGNEYYCPNHNEIRASWAAKCPICGKTLIRRPQQQAEQAIARRQRAEEMRRRVMLNTSISVFDPEAILGARKPLGLTQAQIEKLQAIGMAARDGAKQILTSKQRSELTSLDRLSNYPKTMAQMHNRMLQQMSPSDARMLNLMLGPRKMSDPPTTSKTDPPAKTSQPKASGTVTRGDPPKADPPTIRNNARDQIRDSYRDMYRDSYRDQMRDRNRDYNRDRNLYGYYYSYPYNYGYTYIYPYNYGYTYTYPYSYTWPYSNPYYEPYNYYYQIPNNYGYYPYQYEEYNYSPGSDPGTRYIDEDSEGFGGDEGYGGYGDDEGYSGFGDDEGFGGFEGDEGYSGFGDDEGNGGFSNDEGNDGFSNDEGFGGFGDDEGFGEFGDNEGFGGDGGFGGDEDSGDDEGRI